METEETKDMTEAADPEANAGVECMTECCSCCVL